MVTSPTVTSTGVVELPNDEAVVRKAFDNIKGAGLKKFVGRPTIESLPLVEKFVKEFDVTVAIHNHGPGARYDKLESVVKAVKGRHPLIGACVDTGHVIRTKEDPVKWVRELKKRVWALHIKDDVKQDGGSQNVVIGKGHLDVVGIFQALKDIQFPADGSISLEYEASPQNPLDEMKACLAVAEEAIAKVKA